MILKSSFSPSVIIGEIIVYSRTSEWTVTPDDRQTLIKTFGGNIVEDYGRFESGDVISCEFIFRKKDWDKIINYWKNRTKIDIIKEDSTVIPNARIVIKTILEIPKFPDMVKSKLEFWRI